MAGRWVLSTRQERASLLPSGGELPLQVSPERGGHQMPVAVTSIRTTPLPPGSMLTAASDGIVLVELFGGVCTGLEACLFNGIAVHRYLYCDIDTHAISIDRCACTIHTLTQDQRSCRIVSVCYNLFTISELSKLSSLIV